MKMTIGDLTDYAAALLEMFPYENFTCPKCKNQVFFTGVGVKHGSIYLLGDCISRDCSPRICIADMDVLASRFRPPKKSEVN